MLEYHSQTMHTYRSVRMKSQSIDWENQPQQFKIYPQTFPRIALDKRNLEHHFLYLIGGISAQKSYPGYTYALRTNPSAGALYPTEVYIQIRGVQGFVDGIYHLNSYESALELLHTLKEEEGVESFLHVKKITGYIFLFSALYYRSSWKYKNRAFRYCLHDTGHIIGTVEASCELHKKNYHILYAINKAALNRLFGFGKEEFFLSSVVVGEEDKSFTCKELLMEQPYVDGTRIFEQNTLIEQTYDETSSIACNKQIKIPQFNLDKERLKQAIWNRRSIRDFEEKGILRQEFQEVMRYINEPIPSDCDVKIEIFAIINRVIGMEQGVYKEGIYQQVGDFAHKVGYLCLEQSLGMESGVTFFLVGYDDKNYQAMLQKAGIIGHRLYVISQYLGFGCSGIGAYYDEEVMEFLQTKGMILYALAIGR